MEAHSVNVSHCGAEACIKDQSSSSFAATEMAHQNQSNKDRRSDDVITRHNSSRANIIYLRLIALLVCVLAAITVSATFKRSPKSSLHRSLQEVPRDVAISTDTSVVDSNNTISRESSEVYRDLFLLSGQSNMVGYTTSGRSIGRNGDYWNNIKTILARGGDFANMRTELYDLIYKTNYKKNRDTAGVARTLTNGLRDLYQSSLLNDLDAPLSLGRCSFKEPNNTHVDDVSQGTVPIVWNGNCGHSFGHELLFGRTLELGMNYTNEFEMHKVARGGTGLYKHWYPNRGRHWDLLKNTILDRRGYGDWKGFIWHQGSQAAWSLKHGEDRSLTYLGNLTGLVSEVRELMFQNSISWQCKEEIPVVIVQLGYWPVNSIRAGQRVREAQAEFCKNDPRAVMVETDDLAWFYHYDAASFLISGNRIAHAYQRAMDGVVECPDRVPSSSPSESMQPTVISFESGSPSPTIISELV